MVIFVNILRSKIWGWILKSEVAMGSLLGPVLAKIFMVELKSVLVPKLNDHVKNYWIRFVDDTFVYVKRGLIEYALSVLNLFHDNIKFTYEQENNNR